MSEATSLPPADEFTFSIIFKTAGDFGDDLCGKMIHGRGMKNGFVLDTVVGNSLMTMFGYEAIWSKPWFCIYDGGVGMILEAVRQKSVMQVIWMSHLFINHQLDREAENGNACDFGKNKRELVVSDQDCRSTSSTEDGVLIDNSNGSNVCTLSSAKDLGPPHLDL
ncbi:unnamed protein product [Fraxinus pennsylvanica]|uniref:Uncharacterized protein n=1 Tax=Fraxinus pennsylvanica TaxID=56036 RepID=A0AAD1ZJZ5_9LAMI|nr:unnamed protein product [Fraxinus pennsylvanica]